MLNLYQAHRLFTHEDAVFLHAHKIFGVLVLFNFAYRFWLWAAHCDMMLDKGYDVLAWIGVHAALHVTSFQFHIPSRRNKAYNIIWPEMRWHTMIFAYRSIISLLFQWSTNMGFISQHATDMSKGPLIIATMLAADYTTKYYKSREMVDQKDSTMRGNPYPKGTSETFKRALNLFYSASQVLATSNILVNRDMGRIFLILLPIQIAPFCSTLVKKGIINQAGWHFIYTLALVSNFVYGVFPNFDPPIIPKTIDWALTLGFMIGRFGFNVNKYVLWIAFIVATRCGGALP